MDAPYYISEIRPYAGTIAIPKDWHLCDGTLLKISEYEPLFTLIANRFGGDGIEHFALPNLCGATPIHSGHGPGLSARGWGDKGGASEVTLTLENLPSHAHSLNATTQIATENDPFDMYPAAPPGTARAYISHADSTMVQLGANTTQGTGGGQPFDTMMPTLGINYIIALWGVYPERGSK